MEEFKRVVVSSLDEAINLYKENNVMLDIKSIPFEQKVEILRYVLTNEEAEKIEDPLMILNILNLVKVYNTLDEEYFKSPDVFVSSIEEFLDLKLELSKDIKTFSKKLCIYFLSVLRSYNKLTYTPADEPSVLPNIFKTLLYSTDLITLAGIFAKCDTISTDELLYIENAYTCMTAIITKSSLGSSLLNDFYRELEGATA